MNKNKLDRPVRQILVDNIKESLDELKIPKKRRDLSNPANVRWLCYNLRYKDEGTEVIVNNILQMIALFDRRLEWYG